MRSGSLFELTSRFVPGGQREPLLTLYALRQAVAEIPYSEADDSVKWAKLKWWSDEILADPEAPARHPVLRALKVSGARAKIRNALLQTMVNDAATQIDAAPDSDEHAMFERYAALGSTEIRMEMALEEAEIASRNMEFLGAAMGITRLISGFAANNRTGAGRLPLHLLAKFGVSTSHLAEHQNPEELTEIIAQLVALALDWYSKGLLELAIGPGTGRCLHLQLRWALERRRLTAISKDVAGFLNEGKRYGPTDAWFVWRCLRKLR